MTSASRSMCGSATSTRLAGQRNLVNGGLCEELTRFPGELTVHEDLPLFAEVADHVPVQAGGVLAARLPKAGTESQVHRSADLLVEEDVAREAIDLVVEAEGDLSENSRAVVHVEERAQVVVASRRLGRDHLAVLEAKPHVLHLTPL